ncbi:MAG: hypothetical protein OXT49_04720 [Gammaproteobacteria bacterium]|nr:hypothetical protein [Gammaproteobacteria bacterium]
MLEGIARRWHDMGVERELRGFLEHLKVAPKDELSELYSAAMLARDYVAKLPASKGEFPSELFDKSSSVSEGVAELDIDELLAQLHVLREDLQKSGNPNREAVAVGVTVWMHSLEAIRNGRFSSMAESMWQCLGDGMVGGKDRLKIIADVLGKDESWANYMPWRFVRDRVGAHKAKSA